MTKEYSPWKFSGYVYSAVSRAITSIDDGNIVEAREKLEQVIEEYKLLNRVNGLEGYE